MLSDLYYILILFICGIILVNLSIYNATRLQSTRVQKIVNSLLFMVCILVFLWLFKIKLY